MDKKFYEKVFSDQRMEKYFREYYTEQLAIEYYHANIKISESLYSILSLFEVALRNSLNRELTDLFGTKEWYERIPTTPGLADLNGNISIAKRQISKRNETITADKVVAELTLGFWVRLLNSEYELILWKHLRRAFPFMEKRSRKRKNVSAPINKIRDFRNRVFHHEPISWNIDRVENLRQQILMVIRWINKDLPLIAEKLDRSLEVIQDEKKRRLKSDSAFPLN